MFPKSGQGPPPDAEARLEEWRRVVAGQSEVISDVNETAWKALLLGLCMAVAQRAQKGKKLVQKPVVVREDLEDPRWLTWMMRNIGLLWQEELEVSEAVAEGVRANVDF